MLEVNLIFEVHCYQPSWVKYLHLYPYNTWETESRYRIYVDEDLITERNWNWKWDNILLNENIWVNGDVDSIYTLNLSPVLYNAAQAKFSIKNLKIGNVLGEMKQLTDLQIEYKLINTL
jgi:hypothetical protein